MSYYRRQRRVPRRYGMGDGTPLEQAVWQTVCNDPSSDAYDPTNINCQPIVTNMQTGVSTQGGNTVATPENTACVVKANTATAPLDNYVKDLSTNWNPSGYYTPKQVTDIVAQVMGVLNAAGQAVAQSLSSVGAATSSSDVDNLHQAADTVNNGIAGSAVFTNAASTATSQGITQIDAPGLKRWVTDALDKASSASNAVYAINCVQPWFLGLFNTIAAVFQTAWAVIKAVAGVALDAAKALLSVPDMIGTLISVAKWAAVIGGAYVAYQELVVKRKQRR